MPTLACTTRRGPRPGPPLRSIRRRWLHPAFGIIPTQFQSQETIMNARVLKTMMLPVLIGAAVVLLAASLI